MDVGGHIPHVTRTIKMDPRIGSLWLFATCLGIVMVSCYISGVACDVPDDVVYTDLHKTVRIGDRVVLKCQFRGTPLAVYWKKGDDPERSPSLVSWITGDPATGVCKGERLCRIMEMNAEFSLIIKEVSIVERGLYVCTVENYKGIQIYNFTDISVFSRPKEPYPIINECQMNSPNDTETTCTISTSHSVEISCSASGYFPDIDLYFLHGSTRLYTKDPIEVTNVDGTKNKTLSTIATASKISYTCFASVPGSQEQRTTTVLVNLPTSSSPMPAGSIIPIDKTDGSVAKVVVPIFIVLLAVILICISIVLWRRRKLQRGQGTYTTVLPMGNIGVQKEYKSELTDQVLIVIALNITKRHCQRLGKIFNLPESAIAKRNKEDLKMFRTDKMLKVWVRNQKCSSYEIMCRLRQAAEQCNRQDIADIFIRKEQSEVVTSSTKLQACLTVTNEEQSPGASGSESNKLGNGTSSQSVPHSSHGDLEETQSSVAQPADNIADSEVDIVSSTSISCDELDRIGRYAGSSILLAFCKKYDVTVVSEQLLEIINVLKPTLDSEFKRIKKGKKSNTPRKTLRQLLENEHPRYACLLAMKKPLNIFNVELIDLAFRLIMADVYPFAKALNISDRELNSYRCKFRSHNLTKGTTNIIKEVSIDNRVKMVQALQQAGYSEEARSLYFGFEIGIRDMIEVENRVDMAQLAKQLGVSDKVQSTSPGNQVRSVLFRWRRKVCSSTFNHRLVLADALFTMGEEQLALDIISGAYRNRVIDEQVAELLLANIRVGQLTTLNKILGQAKKNEEKGLIQKSPTDISNELLDAKFGSYAYEYMAVSGHETETRNVASEELHQEGIAINKPEVMQEKSGDGAAESKESTTENVETKEQGNTPDGSNECKQDESSKLLTQAGT